MGGKTRIAKQLSAVIDEYREPGQPVWDAFCGGLSMSVALSKKGPVYSTDACAPLIALYKAVQAGWDPPTEVSRETWQAAKSLPDSDPMKAFCGFGCSFGGNWAGGYAKDQPITRKDGSSAGYQHFAAQSRRLLLKNVPLINSIDHKDFLSVTPEAINQVIYCDIPYLGVTPYKAVAPFDREAFTRIVVQWSRFTHVFVSEYSLPIGDVVWSKPSDSRLNVKSGSAKKTVERLYYIAKGSLT